MNRVDGLVLLAAVLAVVVLGLMWLAAGVDPFAVIRSWWAALGDVLMH
ncbi:hypothetical protein [Pseudonocardia acaciae]|nr:hypothetical protein [Pseudonocardia acaciae]